MFTRELAMALDVAHGEPLGRLEEELRLTPTPVPALFSKIIADACHRLPNLSRSRGVARIDRLIAAGAWTDAAFALVELELPAWSLRRLICEDGEWFCSLSRQPNLPTAFDSTADARHDSLPLAILLAFLQARRMAKIATPAMPAAPHMRPTPNGMICCDNFS
jgi:hypothetical protein